MDPEGLFVGGVAVFMGIALAIALLGGDPTGFTSAAPAVVMFLLLAGLLLGFAGAVRS